MQFKPFSILAFAALSVAAPLAASDAESANKLSSVYRRIGPEDVNLDNVGRAYRRTSPEDVDLDTVGRAYKRTRPEDVNLNGVGRAY